MHTLLLLASLVQQPDELLKAAQQAYGARDYGGAAGRYEQVLKQNSGSPEAAFGLALSLLAQGPADPARVVELLKQAAAVPTFARRAEALAWLGHTCRLWADQKPPDPARLEAAAKAFGEAAGAWRALATPEALEEAIRALVDQAEALLRLGRPKEAAAAAEPLNADPKLATSPHRYAAYYYLGCAAVALKEPDRAGRILSRLAPFDQTEWAGPARVLLGRVHQEAGELAEAAAHYEAVPAAFDRELQAARQAIQNAEALRERPGELARLKELANGQFPEYLADAHYFMALLLYDMKQYEAARERLVLLSQKEKRVDRQAEVRLWQGICLAQLGRFGEAVPALQPLQEKQPIARLWTARSLLRGGDANQRAPAVELLGKLLDTPVAGEARADLADALMVSGKPAEAIPHYQELAKDPARADAALAGLICAFQLSGKAKEADEACARFEKTFPRSPHLSEVLLRHAESALGGAAPAEAAKRYGRLLDGYPDLPIAGIARLRLGTVLMQTGAFADAAVVLRAIPDAERTPAARTLLAEALLRTAPSADAAADALTAARRLQHLEEARDLSAGAQGPEALIRLAWCHQQVAALLADPGARAQSANAGREAYEAFRTQFPEHPLRPMAEYERANCYVLAGDPNTAMAKLVRFQADPFAASAPAPLATVRYAQLLRAAGRAAEAVPLLQQARARHEEALGKDAARRGWVPMMRYHHALALKEANQKAESAKLLQALVKEFGQSEWAQPAKDLLGEIGL